MPGHFPGTFGSCGVHRFDAHDGALAQRGVVAGSGPGRLGATLGPRRSVGAAAAGATQGAAALSPREAGPRSPSLGLPPTLGGRPS